VSVERWTEIVARVTGHEPDDLDDLLAPFDRRERAGGGDLFPPVAGVLMPQAPMARPDAVAVGFRVTERLEDVADRALRLAAFALEQDVEVIVLAHIDESGFERFGFRVERIAGADEAARAACEDQVRRFWNIDLVL
jgi:hypothetical protein